MTRSQHSIVPSVSRSSALLALNDLTSLLDLTPDVTFGSTFGISSQRPMSSLCKSTSPSTSSSARSNRSKVLSPSCSHFFSPTSSSLSAVPSSPSQPHGSTSKLCSTISPSSVGSCTTLAQSPAPLSPPLPVTAFVVHSQIGFQHHFVPDIVDIVNAPFYWGPIDRHVAERLLHDRPEGTFLLRDSAQPHYLFSVSFRRFGQTLHARIEQAHHRFGFDPYDPSVFSSHNVCQLLTHYKSPSHCNFFEPLLTKPLARRTPFSLKALCRARITASCSYGQIDHLQLPHTLQHYLREYHYRVPVTSRRFH